MLFYRRGRIARPSARVWSTRIRFADPGFESLPLRSYFFHKMNKLILIVEDNDSLRAMEKKVLESEGYEVLTADNARDGVARALEKKPDLIIMDIRLPSKKRGIGAARLIRKTEGIADIPIIFVTAYTKGQYTAEVKNISNSAYITKPFEIKDLIDKVKRYMV